MASTSETGHAKNVANFEDLISFCQGYGTAYNPSKAAIQLPALNTLYSNAQNALAWLTSNKTVFDNATNAQFRLSRQLTTTTDRRAAGNKD